jgi:DNA-binding protein YbaB
MKNTQKNQLMAINTLFSTFQTGLLSALGLVGPDIDTDETETENVRKTSAKIRVGSNRSEMKKVSKSTKPQGDEDTVIIRVPSDGDTRVRIPARCFNSKGIVHVDNTRYDALESDNGRSHKIQPEVFDAEPGDTIVLTEIGPSKYESSVESGTRKAKAKRAQKTQEKAQPKTTANKAKSGKLSLGGKASSKVVDRDVDPKVKEMDLEEGIEEFARRAIKNANEGFENENIRDNSPLTEKLKARGIKQDPRVYLTTQQHKQFKKFAENNELSVLALTEMLYNEVFE